MGDEWDDPRRTITGRGSHAAKGNRHQTLSISITVHCQPVAYDPDDLTKTDQNSRPSYWQNVLKTEELQTLRINFAHFGGGQNIPELFDEHGTLRRDNETSLIIDMLRNYPHTYADLAAINFRDEKISEGFTRLLTKDLQEEHGTKHSLCKKIIWGSDVPMVIESPQYHREQGGDGPEMGYIHS